MRVAAEQARLLKLQIRPPISLPSVFCLDGRTQLRRWSTVPKTLSPPKRCCPRQSEDHSVAFGAETPARRGHG